MQLEIYFLFTRVRETDVDDYKKMARFVNYIQVTFSMPLIL